MGNGQKNQPGLASFFAKASAGKTRDASHTDAAQANDNDSPKQHQRAEVVVLDSPQHAPAAGQHAPASASMPSLPAKRPRSDSADASTVAQGAAAAQASGGPASAQTGAATTAAQPAAPAEPAARDPMRQALAKRKLSMTGRRLVLGPDASERTASAQANSKAKLTPLEQQVVDLKMQNAGKVLIVEVRAGTFAHASVCIANRCNGTFAGSKPRCKDTCWRCKP